MIRYWDHSEKERAALTEDQIKAMLTVEMMEKGVLNPGPSPELSTPKQADLPKTTFYRPTCESYYGKPNVLFTTMEDAQAFVALKPRAWQRDYQADTDYAIGAKTLSVEVIELPEEDVITTRREELRRIHAENEANKKKIEAHAEAVKKADKVTDGVWDDWHECKGKGREYGRVIATFNSYASLADGNEATARKFLAKAYPEQTIVDAFAWCEVADPATSQKAAEAA